MTATPTGDLPGTPPVIGSLSRPADSKSAFPAHGRTRIAEDEFILPRTDGSFMIGI
jgi:hypothetical protein